MEIRVKTPTEFRDGHVTIEIRADQDEAGSVSRRLTEPSGLAGRLYTQAENQALEAQVHDLRNELNGVRGHSEGLENRVRDLVAERDALLLKSEADRADDHNLVAAARVGRNAEKQRADENQAWAERTEALLENVTTERDALRLQVEDAERELKGYRAAHVCTVECKPNEHTAFQGRKMLTELKGQLVRIQDEVWSPTLDMAVENRGNLDWIPVSIRQDLANAVSAVRSIVGQP
jgi:hypothetical protein